MIVNSGGHRFDLLFLKLSWSFGVTTTRASMQSQFHKRDLLMKHKLFAVTALSSFFGGWVPVRLPLLGAVWAPSATGRRQPSKCKPDDTRTPVGMLTGLG